MDRWLGIDFSGNDAIRGVRGDGGEDDLGPLDCRIQGSDAWIEVLPGREALFSRRRPPHDGVSWAVRPCRLPNPPERSIDPSSRTAPSRARSAPGTHAPADALGASMRILALLDRPLARGSSQHAAHPLTRPFVASLGRALSPLRRVRPCGRCKATRTCRRRPARPPCRARCRTPSPSRRR